MHKLANLTSPLDGKLLKHLKYPHTAPPSALSGSAQLPSHSLCVVCGQTELTHTISALVSNNNMTAQTKKKKKKAFKKAVDARDVPKHLRGEDSDNECYEGRFCVVCGPCIPVAVDRTLVLSDDRENDSTWRCLREHQWIPEEAEADRAYEPRNSISLCANHRVVFNDHLFFIRYVPLPPSIAERKRILGIYVFVATSNHPELKLYDGTALSLDASHRYAPLPSLFLVHEMRARERFPSFTEAHMPEIDFENLSWSWSVGSTLNPVRGYSQSLDLQEIRRYNDHFLNKIPPPPSVTEEEEPEESQDVHTTNNDC